MMLPYPTFSARLSDAMKTNAKSFARSSLLLAGAAVALAGACEKKSVPPPGAQPNRAVALLLAQAHFGEQPAPGGKTRVVPLPAKLTFVYPDGEHWATEALEDPEANVFHKAMVFDLPGEQPGILTIGANKDPLPATLKVWRRGSDGWQDTVLWQVKFGGKFNRLRDVEIGDVTGDGQPDIVVATHDEGVVAVLQRKGARWEPTEIDRAPRTFVHEIEIGDVDGDGRNEIFATPSAPNKADGTPQPGWVVMYRFDGEAFVRQVVEKFGDRHVKEILVADVEGTGRCDLYAVLEVELGQHPAPGGARKEVEIKRYRFTDAGPTGTLIATLPDKQCRFLHAGDVDGDGKAELIASAFRSGIWMIKPEGQEWTTRLIDEDSSGYEHASVLADLDGDGKLEIYVAADDQQQLRRYRWTGEQFERSDLLNLGKSSITWGLMPCRNAKCLAPPGQ